MVWFHHTNLERLQESPQQDAYGVAESQEFDEAHGAKQTEETRVDTKLGRLALKGNMPYVEYPVVY